MYSVWVCSVLSAWFNSDDGLYKYRTSWRQTWLSCRYCRRAPVGQDGAIPILVLPKVNDRLTPHESSARHTHGYDNSVNLRLWSYWKRKDRIVSDRSFPDRPVEFSTPMNLIWSVSIIVKTQAAQLQPSHSHKERVDYALLLPVLTDFSGHCRLNYLLSNRLGDAGSVTTLINRACDFDRPVAETLGHDPARFACIAPAV
jgi:hypothetical protein